MATQVVNGLSGAIGCRFLPTHNQLLFVEYGGTISILDLIRPYLATVSSGTTVLQGTATFDLDTGTQHTGTPPGDLWWEQQTATVRDMKPMAGAKIVNLGHIDFNAITAAQLQGLPYGTAAIPGNPDATNQLTDGDVFAVLTNAGYYAKVQVLHYDYNMTIRWATYQVGPKRRIIGTGYAQLEDIAATADEAHAYVTERGTAAGNGHLYRVTLASANRTSTTTAVVATGMTAPQQLFLDEANHAAYVVEFAASGRLLKIALPGGAVTPLITGLDHPVGLLLTADRQTAYVSEQGSAGGRVVKITLATGVKVPVAEGLTQPFFLTWADASEQRILLTERGTARKVDAIDLTRSPAVVTTLAVALPANPSSCAVVGPTRMLVCCNDEIDELPLPGLIPSATAPLLMGIGKVPFDRIGLPAASAPGLANTTGDATNPYQVANVPFGGTLPLLINHLRAFADGARFYRVMVDGVAQPAGLSGYRWNASTNRFEYIAAPTFTFAAGPGFLRVHDVAEMALWLNPALGAQLRTVGLSNATHGIRIDFVNASGTPVESSATLTVLVNNQACAAFIEQPKLGTSVADTDCGLLKYTKDSAGHALGSVNMAFTASHPAGFGTYTFRVVKGAGNVRVNLSGQAVLPGTHSASDTAADLLGACKIAGFAESLYVAATMIDGESRQSQYDASGLTAFVLAPE